MVQRTTSYHEVRDLSEYDSYTFVEGPNFKRTGSCRRIFGYNVSLESPKFEAENT